MKVVKHYQSINREIGALKDRIANVVGHNGAIGEWRESVLRGILRRYLPPTLGVGHGFVMLPDGTATTQIDVIVYDQSYPRYVQEGEFIIITSDAVRAIVEVKSSTVSESINESLTKLATATRLIRSQARLGGSEIHRSLWSGYFALEQPRAIRSHTLGNYIGQACHTEEDSINGLCLGPERFVRLWIRRQGNGSNLGKHISWLEYNLAKQAYGYFIMNLVSRVCNESIRNNHDFWFPAEGKGEGLLICQFNELNR